MTKDGILTDPNHKGLAGQNDRYEVGQYRCGAAGIVLIKPKENAG